MGLMGGAKEAYFHCKESFETFVRLKSVFADFYHEDHGYKIMVPIHLTTVYVHRCFEEWISCLWKRRKYGKLNTKINFG